MTSMNPLVADQLIRDRTTQRAALQRPRHDRTVRVLRGMANYLDPRS
jgi:hypothetical protein